MQLKVTKENGLIILRLCTDTTKKPIEIRMTPAQVELVVSMVQAAAHSDRFDLSIEV